MNDSVREPLILGIGGTERAQSSGQRALQATLKHAEILGCQTTLVAGADLVLPMYAPGDTTRNEKAARLIALYR